MEEDLEINFREFDRKMELLNDRTNDGEREFGVLLFFWLLFVLPPAIVGCTELWTFSLLQNLVTIQYTNVQIPMKEPTDPTMTNGRNHLLLPPPCDDSSGDCVVSFLIQGLQITPVPEHSVSELGKIAHSQE